MYNIFKGQGKVFSGTINHPNIPLKLVPNVRQMYVENKNSVFVN
jgi:hypothetical protein